MVTGAPMVELADRYCLGDGEAERLLAGHPWQRFAVVGDSIAEGLGDRVDGYPDQSWTDRVAAELARRQPAFTQLNLGRRDTRAARVRATQLDPALAFAPDLAVVACGGYDSLSPAFDPGTVDAEMRAIVRALREQGCAVITVSMFDGSRNPAVPAKHRGWLRRRLTTVAENTRRLAAELGTIHIDLFGHPASGENIYSADGRHGNRRGHAIAAAETVRGLGAHLTGGGTANAH